jgi:SAM-dependent methyltransferase
MASDRVEEVLAMLERQEDGTYGYYFENSDQQIEVRERQSVALRHYPDYLAEIARHHSIPVMDRELDLFLRNIPRNGLIVDVGGGWGWYWRDLNKTRPDLVVFLVDLVRENLTCAMNILEGAVGKNVYLVHGDAINLVFEDNTFDGYWSVQALQHVPDFGGAVNEAYRVLKPGGVFASYSLNRQLFIEWLFRMTGKRYHRYGYIGNAPYYLNRASREQALFVKNTFSNDVRVRYSEFFFQPDLRLLCFGKDSSYIGRVDSMLSGGNPVFSLLAHQQSYHTHKTRNPVNVMTGST